VFNPLNRYISHSFSFENVGAAREIELENKLISPEFQLRQEEQTRMFKHLPLKSILASDYLCQAESYLTNLIAVDKFQEILSIAKNFPGNVTSFLGFEIHLKDTKQRADWAFAVSGEGSDREVLVRYCITTSSGSTVIKKGTASRYELHQEDTGGCVSFPGRDNVISFFK